MENMIEQTISNNSRCYTCGGLVYAVEKKRTTNHVRLFRCLKQITIIIGLFRLITVDVFVVEFVKEV